MQETACSLPWPVLEACFRKDHPQLQYTSPLGCEYYTWKYKRWAWKMLMSLTFQWQKESLFKVAKHVTSCMRCSVWLTGVHLWELKNTYSTVTIENRTRVDRNFFGHIDLGNCSYCNVLNSWITLYSLMWQLLDFHVYSAGKPSFADQCTYFLMLIVLLMLFISSILHVMVTSLKKVTLELTLQIQHATVIQWHQGDGKTDILFECSDTWTSQASVQQRRIESFEYWRGVL